MLAPTPEMLTGKGKEKEPAGASVVSLTTLWADVGPHDGKIIYMWLLNILVYINMMYITTKIKICLHVVTQYTRVHKHDVHNSKNQNLFTLFE